MNDDELRKQFGECCGKNLFTLVDDKIYRCPFAANLERVDEMAIDERNYIKVSETKSAINDYLYKIDYLPACNYCKGRSYSSPTIKPAIQTRKVLELPRN